MTALQPYSTESCGPPPEVHVQGHLFGWLELDQTCTILKADNAVAAILGRTETELVGARLPDLALHWAEQRPPEGGHEQSHLLREMDFARPDGSPVICLIGCLSLEQDRLRCILIDLTERRREEEELRESRAHLDNMLHGAPDLIYRLDTEGRIVFASGAFELYGYDRDLLLGHRMLEIIHPDDREHAARKIDERRTGQRKTRYLEVRFLPGPRSAIIGGSDNRVFLVSAEGYYLEDEQGRRVFAGTQGVAKDITERKAWEEELRSSQAELSAIFDSAPLFMALIDEKCRLRKINRSGARTLGRPLPELINRPWGEIFGCANYVEREVTCGCDQVCKNCTVGNVIRKTFDFGQGFDRYEVQTGVLRLGERRDVSLLLSSTRLIIGGQMMVLLCLEDISERRQLEEQLQLRQRMDSLGTLAGGIAHDFNNLLTGIMGNISMLSMQAGRLSEVQSQCVRDAERSCQRAGELIRQFQSLSGGFVAERRSVDMYEVGSEVFSLLDKTTDRLIEKAVDFKPGRFYVNANPGELSQVFLNLGTNAVQAIEEKGVSEGDHIRLRASLTLIGQGDPSGLAPGDYVHLTFSDSGVGMSLEVQRRAFDPLFTTKAKARKGQGLGLSMVYNIVVRKYGGRVYIESAPGRGSDFHIFLPAVEAILLEEEHETAELPGGSETILVIDDEEVVQKFVGLSLGNLGYKVLSALDGRTGLELFEKNEDGIDLVLLDLTMPRMSGATVFQKIIARKPEARVLISSGHNDECVDNGLVVRAAGYLSKPYTAEDLANVVRRVLDS
ncbi:PAS domain S-box protein [bacterium]|nr:PAS domain S-box protein [bacterium]